jgi:hypothetical protein
MNMEGIALLLHCEILYLRFPSVQLRFVYNGQLILLLHSFVSLACGVFWIFLFVFFIST